MGRPAGSSQRFAAQLAPHYGNSNALRFDLVPNAPHWPPSAAIDAAADWLTTHLKEPKAA